MASLSKQDVTDRISFRIHTASRLIQQMSRRRLKTLDLTPAQWRALLGVCTEQGLTLQKLTEFARMSQPLISQAVKVLENKKLVTRSSPVGDKRVSILVATPKGISLGEKAYALVMEIEEQIISSLGQNGPKRLNAQLDRLIAGCE